MTPLFKVVKPSGILDGVATNELKLQVLEFIQDETDVVLIDMEDVTFMNSSGIGALVSILKSLRAKNKELYLCGLSNQVQMIFELTKMNRVFKTYSSLEEFEVTV
ncbi:STAS domain-containing protein [Sphaerothrix gracilis]|uniref:STAS domain-containing protein n=1 Tax=Sphaerothrix gracilis TaxID=3151835 RepID=UPI0031FBF6DF